VVGAVVAAIIIGAIYFRENRIGAAAAELGDLSVPIITAAPRATRTIPSPDVPRISVEETNDKMDKGEVVLVDVRSGEAYDRSHATGAISIPENEVDARLDEIPRDVDVVFYCT
jgi:phosphohistidine swiveling domain-containing protein